MRSPQLSLITNEKLSEILFTLKNKTNIHRYNYLHNEAGWYLICIVSLHNVKHYCYSDLAQRDIVHNTLLALHSLQLYCCNLHQESVFITIKFQ